MSAELAPPVEAASRALPGDFWRAWLAHTLSQGGDRIHQVAVLWWTLATTGSLALTGAMLMATSLPAVILGPVAGTLADRIDRKRLMVACDALRAMVVLILSGLAFQGLLSVPLLLLTSAVLASLTAFFQPAAFSLVPTIVPPAGVLRATGLMESSTQGMAMVGPALGGVVVAALGAEAAFGLNALSFLLSAACLAGVSFPSAAAGAVAERFGEAMRGGFRLLRREKTIAGVLAGFACVNVFTMPVLLYMPYFAKEVFFEGPRGLGFLDAALGAGMLASALYWARRGEVARRFPVVVGGIAGVGAAIAVMGLWPLFPVHLAALFAAGALMGSVNVVMIAYFQSQVPPTEMGRFFGLLTSICSGLAPLSFGAYGLLGGVVAPATLLVVNGAMIGLVALGLAAVPGFREA